MRVGIFCFLSFSIITIVNAEPIDSLYSDTVSMVRTTFVKDSCLTVYQQIIERASLAFEGVHIKRCAGGNRIERIYQKGVLKGIRTFDSSTRQTRQVDYLDDSMTIAREVLYFDSTIVEYGNTNMSSKFGIWYYYDSLGLLTKIESYVLIEINNDNVQDLIHLVNPTKNGLAGRFASVKNGKCVTFNYKEGKITETMWKRGVLESTLEKNLE